MTITAEPARSRINWSRIVGQTPAFRIDPRARCRDLDDPDDMYPTHNTGIAAAKKICRPCPLKTECAEWAIEKGEFGVWGGLNEKERRAIKRRRAAGEAA